jgi:hypothetical protein
MAERTGYQTFAKSYGAFTLQAGEVVNLGFLRARHVREKVAFPAIALTVELAVTDWPLQDLKRFEQERPTLYADMKTRLLTLAKQ